MIAQLGASPKETCLAFTKDWLKLLSQSKIDIACSMLDEPDYYGQIWTAERLAGIVADIAKCYPEGLRFTDPYVMPSLTMAQEQAYTSFVKFDDTSGYLLDYPVPVNDQWSDWSAEFEFRQRSEGYAVILNHIDVM